MPQERLSSLENMTLGPEWLQQGFRSSPKREAEKAVASPSVHRYGRDQLLLFQSAMLLPAAPRLANGRPKPTEELEPGIYPVFGAMTKENLVSDGVLPASSLEDKGGPVAGTLRGRAEGRGKGKGGARGKGREEEDEGSPKKEVQASPVQTAGSGASGALGLPPMELPSRQVSGEEGKAAPRNPMNNFLARVLKPSNEPNQAEVTPAPRLGLPPPTGPPAALGGQPESQEAPPSPTHRPPVPGQPPPPPPGTPAPAPAQAPAQAPPCKGWLEPLGQIEDLPMRPGPLMGSPPRQPPTLSPTMAPEALPEPLVSPQRSAVNLASALASAVTAPQTAPMASAFEMDLGLNLGDGLLAPAVTAPPPQALQPGRVTIPPRQAGR
ncbi:Uncharacterized protein SCF082_LOCUS20879 [Durusdinium trenchii]|uniref:Uncharacterized protein n=1 Tax=Durusdinium trenchii TaxID=1381693 RepID=A0ABP0L6T7_9DINO